MGRVPQSSNSEYGAPSGTAAGDFRVIVPRLMILAIVGGGLLLLLVYPFPLRGRLWRAVFDLGHCPAFFFLLLVVVGILDPVAAGLANHRKTIWPVTRMRLVGLCLLGVLSGIVGELLQHVSGRHASGSDVAANCAGLLAGYFWIRGNLGLSGGQIPASPRHWYRLCSGLTILATSLIPVLEIRECLWQRWDVPVLNSFERRQELRGWSAHQAEISRSEEWSAEGRTSLKIQLWPGIWPGADMIWPYPDWTGHVSFCVEAFNSSDLDLRLAVKIQDTAHPNSGYDPADRFEREYRLPAGGRESIRIRLADVVGAPASRTMRLDQIAQVEFFCIGLRKPAVLFLDHLRLD